MGEAEGHDVIVIGAGPAGCAAAAAAARAGARVLLLDRGAGPGSRTGEVLYGAAWRAAFPALAAEGPLERAIVRRRAILLGTRGAASLDLRADAAAGLGHAVQREALDPWLCAQARRAGADVRIGSTVDEILWRRGAVAGVRVGTGALLAPVVVAAPGGGSALLHRAGLAPGPDPRRGVVVGARLRIALPSERIEDRLGLEPGEGLLAHIFGCDMGGAAGCGYLVTYRAGLGLGLVLRGGEEGGEVEELRVARLLERLRARPGVRELVAGGRVERLSVRLVPAVPRRVRRVGEGLLVAGDAAGLAADTGRAVAGLGPALISGCLAGETAALAARKGDASRAILGRYEERLAETGLLRGRRSARRTARFFRRTRFLRDHAEIVVEAGRRSLAAGEPPHRRLLGLLGEALEGQPLHVLDLLRDGASALFRL